MLVFPVPTYFFVEVCGLQCSLVLLILATMAHQKREREAKEIGRDLGVYQWSLGCHAHFEFLFFAWYCQMTSALCSAETGDILNMNLGWIGIKIMGSVVQSQKCIHLELAGAKLFAESFAFAKEPFAGPILSGWPPLGTLGTNLWRRRWCNPHGALRGWSQGDAVSDAATMFFPWTPGNKQFMFFVEILVVFCHAFFLWINYAGIRSGFSLFQMTINRFHPISPWQTPK